MLSSELLKLNVFNQPTKPFFYLSNSVHCFRIRQLKAMLISNSNYAFISRSEQAPGSVFQPHDKNEQIDCDFLGPSWCNIKEDPKR